MLDYGTHQILHKQRLRDLIAQRENDALARSVHPEWGLRLPAAASIIRLLRRAARPLPTRAHHEPKPCLQGAGEGS